MKKMKIINLIKYYTEKNDSGFRSEAYQIAKDFDKSGDYQLSEYIVSLLSDSNVFISQISENGISYFRFISLDKKSLPLPSAIKDDIIGLINAIGHKVGINKFLFEGAPGTGKTETAKHVARILNRELYQMQFNSIIDSKLGQTSKNLASAFKEISELKRPDKVMILIDEIDALALDRLNSNDLREMGRVTSTLLEELENLDNNIVLIATTNLFKHFDKALLRRFDSVVNFNRYTKEDLVDISEIIFNEYLEKFDNVSRDIRLFRKIISIPDTLPYPGDLRNIIKTSLAFSNPDDKNDYFVRLYETLNGVKIDNNIKLLQSQGFTIREIEKLTQISKSKVERGLNA